VAGAESAGEYRLEDEKTFGWLQDGPIKGASTPGPERQLASGAETMDFAARNATPWDPRRATDRFAMEELR